MKAISAVIASLFASSIVKAEKVILHDIEQKSQLNARSFSPFSNTRDVGSNRISFRGNSSSASEQDETVVSQDYASENERNGDSTTSVVGNAMSIGIPVVEHTFDESTARKDQISPFLSTTLMTTLSPIPTSSVSTFDDAKQLSFGDAYIAFLEHVLKNQEVYDVKVLSVSIFDEELLSLDGDAVQERDGGRHLLTNGLQFSFNEDYDDYEYDDETASDDISAGNEDNEGFDNGQWVYKSLRFGIVLSAEHTLEPSEERFMSDEQFEKIVLHISSKFHSHLLEYVRDADLYFRNVDLVDVVSYAGDDELTETKGDKMGIFKRMENEMKNVEEGKLNTFSIVAIALGALVFFGLMFATVKFYKREKMLKANRWRSQEIANSNANTSTVNSLRVLYGKQPFDDDYSFDPLGSNVEQREQVISSRPSQLASAKQQIQRIYKGYTDIPLQHHQDDEELAFSEWPKPSPLFPGAPPTSVSKSTLAYKLDDERISPETLLYNLPRQHVYAPPGKVGVAIDIQDGQPVVHKVKKGSPLEGLLQPQDIVVAIDDVDTNCMSAADVTHLMVKRMNYRRKITFVRRG